MSAESDSPAPTGTAAATLEATQDAREEAREDARQDQLEVGSKENEQAPATSGVEFEQALVELETLVERMEAGELSLEESLKTYERGVRLSRVCQEALSKAEQRIRILTEQDGDSTAPFEPNDN